MSLETLRAVIQRLGRSKEDLTQAHFILVGQQVEVAATIAELVTRIAQAYELNLPAQAP